jgi:predicted transcriptional regulator
MNRCRHDVTNDLLRALSAEPRRITALCSVGNLPVDRGKELILDLEKFGMIYETEGEEGTEYRITDRGYEWVGLYKLLKKSLPL